MIQLGTILAFFALHVALWFIQGAIADASGGLVCDTPMCGTPVEGIVSAFDRTPTLSLNYLFGGVTDIIGSLWGLLSFDYSLLSGGMGMPWDIFPYSIRLAGLATAAIMLLTLSTTILGRR